MRKSLIFFTAKELSNVGGGERVLAVLSNGLSERYDITVLTPYETESYYHFGEGIRVDTLGLCRPSGFFARKIQLLKVALRLKKYLSNKRFDKLIAPHTISIILTSFVVWSNYDKLIAWVHQSYFQKDPFLLRWIYFHSLRKFTVIATNTMDMDYYKQYTDKVLFMNNPLSFHVENKSNTHKKRLISVGRLSHSKGFDHLIKICSNAFRKKDGWCLDIYGQDDGDKNKLLDLIKTEGMDGRIRILQPVKTIHDEMVNSSIFVFCSLIECFGLVLLEACECGLPCVAYNSPSGIRDIVKDGYNGYLIDMYDDATFEKRILELMNEEDLRKKMGENASEFASKFTDKEILKQWYDLIG